MVALKDKSLALFFTTGISLRKWQKLGSLEREISYYQELSKHFKKVYFLTYGDKTELALSNLLPENIVILYNRWHVPAKLYSFLMPFFYRQKLKEVDFYKTNQMSGAWAAVIAKWLYGKKLVVRCGYELLFFLEQQSRSWLKIFLVKFAEKSAYNNADKIIVTSVKDKDFIIKRFNIDEKKIMVIFNYIDVDLFKPIVVDKETERIIFVGRLEKQKNLFSLIEAIGNTKIKLIVFGAGSLQEELAILADKNNVQIEFRGNIANSKLPIEINRSILFILPSWYEGCPKTLLEAMACGMPCVATNVAGIREFVIHEQDAYLCGTDAISIKEAILKILADNNLRLKLGSEARKKIVANFSLEKISNEELEIYQFYAQS